MSRFVLEKHGRSLIPIEVEGVDYLAQYPQGKRFIVDMRVPVNEKHFRLYQTLASKIVKAGAWSGDRESFADWIKMRTGHIRTVIDPETGTSFVIAKSISPESWGDDEFREWFDKAIEVICEKLLGRPDWAWLRNEVVASVERRNPGYRS